MINRKDHPVPWALLMQEITDLHEHVGALVRDMEENSDYGEEEFAIDVGHLYAHLNRIWNARGRTKETTEEEWQADTEFPSDIDPVG